MQNKSGNNKGLRPDYESTDFIQDGPNTSIQNPAHHAKKASSAQSVKRGGPEGWRAIIWQKKEANYKRKKVIQIYHNFYSSGIPTKRRK